MKRSLVRAQELSSAIAGHLDEVRRLAPQYEALMSKLHTKVRMKQKQSRKGALLVFWREFAERLAGVTEMFSYVYTFNLDNSAFLWDKFVEESAGIANRFDRDFAEAKVAQSKQTRKRSRDE